MKTIGVFYLNISELPNIEVDNHVARVLKTLGDSKELGVDQYFVVPVRDKESEWVFWGDTTENCTPSNELIKKIKHQIKVVP